MVVNCSLCGREMVIDEPNGEAYITEADGRIRHVICPPTPSKEAIIRG